MAPPVARGLPLGSTTDVASPRLRAAPIQDIADVRSGKYLTRAGNLTVWREDST